MALELSPVERHCPDCEGLGRLRPDWELCPRCDGIGRTWIEGGPLFGCKMTLGSRKVGEIVTLGSGERGRIVAHTKRGMPVTRLFLFDFFDQEEKTATLFPSCIGISSVTNPVFVREDTHGNTHGREDIFDPLQRR